jgi:hypothetical protein
MATDDRAERAVLSHAEAYRLVIEAHDQRARAEAAEAALDHLKARATALLNEINTSDDFDIGDFSALRIIELGHALAGDPERSAP